MATAVEGDFEWDEDKAASNAAKHGVSSAERDVYETGGNS